MKYAYAVKVNGKIYKPNTEVPEAKAAPEKATETAKTSTKKDKE